MAQIDTRPGCKMPRCRNRAEKGGYCKDHKTEIKYKSREYDARRDQKKVKVYNSNRWKKTRLRVLEDRPLCTRCENLSIITPAVMVDHLVGFIDENDVHAWDHNYLFPLCSKCHGIVTAKEKRINFLQMPLIEAVFLKYEGIRSAITDTTIYI